MNKVERAIEVLNKELDFQFNRLTEKIKQCQKRIDFIQDVLDILNENDK